MNIRKIYRRFFYLNTGPKNGLKPTTNLSTFEAFIAVVFFVLLKKILFPYLKISLPFFFLFFIIICIILVHYNNKEFKRHYNNYTSEWKNETRKMKILYIICNVVFIISTFSIVIYILKYLDYKN